MPVKHFSLLHVFFLLLHVTTCAGMRKKVHLPARQESGSAFAHLGLEVEFADGKIERKLKTKNGLKAQYKRHTCAPLLEYAVPWFSSEQTTTDLEEDWGSNFPLLEIESEVYERNTIEVVSGPLSKNGVVKAATSIVMLSKILKQKNVPLASEDAVTFQKLAEEATGLTLLSHIEDKVPADCAEKVYIKAANSALTAGVQVNFEMKLSQVPKLAVDGEGSAFNYFGAGGIQFWRQAKECLDAYTAATGEEYSPAVQGALLLTFHQSAVVADCERAAHKTACKKGRVSLLPKVTLDSTSTKAGDRRTLNEVTGKTWYDHKAIMKKLKACPTPSKWRPDNHMFSKAVPGVGGDSGDPIVVMEARSGASGIAYAVKSFLSYYESSPKTPDEDRSAVIALGRQVESLQEWAFADKTNSELLATS